MAQYLRDYADHWKLSVRTGVDVKRLQQHDEGFCAETSAGRVLARHVMVATGPFRRRHVPDAAHGLAPEVHQLHSYDYRSPADVPPGDVLVVGGGNSAAQLAVELSRTHTVTVAAPRPPWYLPVSVAGVDLYWWTLADGPAQADRNSRTSRCVPRTATQSSAPELRQLVAGGEVRLLPHRVVAGTGTQVQRADGRTLPVRSVLWCTGSRLDTAWIDVPGALDDRGEPVHDRGASSVPDCIGWDCRGRACPTARSPTASTATHALWRGASGCRRTARAAPSGEPTPCWAGHRET